MITFPNSKINLGLHIVEKRSDGYHNLETIFYPIPLEDALEVTVSGNGTQPFSFHQSGASVSATPEDNIVVKAYLMLSQKYHLPPIDIYLHKHTPSGAGLGGGSADAAFMLKMLNGMFALGLSTNTLEEYAAQLGADCTFFIRNKPTFAEGVGNIFTPVDLSLKGYQLLVVKPDVFVSTKEAFAHITPQKPQLNLTEVIKHPIEEWKEILKNDFEESIFRLFPAIAQIKSQLYEEGAIYAAMSGSGSAVYGIFAESHNLSGIQFNQCFTYSCVL